MTVNITTHLADIINYQIDVDFAQKFAPEITKLLADGDRDVVRNAAELSHDLSKSEAACFVMTKSPELVKALINALGAAKEGKEERKMKEAATGALFNLSGYDQVKLRITQLRRAGSKFGEYLCTDCANLPCLSGQSLNKHKIYQTYSHNF